MKPCTVCGIHERRPERPLCNDCYLASKRTNYHKRKNPRRVIVDLKRERLTVEMPLTDGRAAKLTERIDSWKRQGYTVEIKE